MPWHLLGSPSIQLGILQAVLERATIPCRSHSLHLEFQSFLEESSRSGQSHLTIDEYGEICSRWENLGAGDWVFAVPPARSASRPREERYVSLLRANGMSKKLAGRLRRLRERVPAFLERCADEILESLPAVVGFTSVYSQNWPSAALAHRLKERDPRLKIVFGGASCEGSMGLGLLAAFPWIDVVVRGEAEGVLIPLMEALLAGAPVPRLPGLCFREGGRTIDVPAEGKRRVAMDEIPAPVYDEYFDRLSCSGLASRIRPQVPFESARGCWWGVKFHCTFCGLNGMDMAFRSKSPERVLGEVTWLAARHGVLDFTAVDNIMDMKYFSTLLPGLVERGHDLGFFYETKANLSAPQVESLRNAGVRTIQPGIESLSTPILRLMRKGVTAFQNIRLLKWCAQNDVRVIWNLIYGFPHESPDEYARMAELVPALVHLAPPTLSKLMIYRFSPYHDRPAEYGLELRGPLAFYGLLYDVDEESLADLAQAFEYTHEDGREPESYVGPLRKEIEDWNRNAGRNAGALTYRRGPGFLIITDTRSTTGPASYTLGEAESVAYLACDGGATPKSIAAEIQRRSRARLTAGRLESLLRDLVDARLVYEEEGKYLALAVPNPR